MGKTSIEWTDFSVSPIRARSKETGKVFHFCERVSPGCKLCYAATMAKRFGLPDYVKANRSKVEFFIDDKVLQGVLSRRKPTRYFWEDCSDLFGSWVPDEWIDKCFAVMALTSRHVHQVLTKRSERMHQYVTALGGDFPRLERAARTLGYTLKWSEIPLVGWPLNAVWLGTSCEDQQRADERIPLLLKTPAAVRFLSCEPLLGGIDLADAVSLRRIGDPQPDWVIVGGESGPGARACDHGWIRQIVNDCQLASVPCFVKQLGKRSYYIAEPSSVKAMRNGWNQCRIDVTLKDKKGGDPAEWPEDLRVRQFPREVATA